MNAAQPRDTSSSPEGRTPHPDEKTISGRWVVLGMLLFGLLMTGSLAVYWELYTRPFRPAQLAIAERFPGSQPRVVGGRYKSHIKGNPEVLRVVTRVKFDPSTDEPRARERAALLFDIIAEHVDLDAYEVLEIHLYQLLPEDELRKWALKQPLEDWQQPPAT
ncbi:MAG: hypothetical protein ACF8TS_18375 [Maioricimonas sp. JB049]